MKKKISVLFIVSSALIFLPFVTPSVTRASSDGIVTPNTAAESSESRSEENNSYGIDDSGYYMPIPIEWQTIDADITAAIGTPNSYNVNVLTGNAFEIPAETLRHISGRDVTLALQTGNEFAFSISGQDVKSTDSPFTLSLTAPSIPDDLLLPLTADASVSRVFCMTERNIYPFRVNVHMDLGQENAGKLAMLYYYDDVNRSMKITGAFRITDSGQAMFGLNRGDEYVVVVADKVTGYTVTSGDTFSHIAHRNHISLNALKAANPHISDYDRIRIGQVINLPLR